MKSKNPNPPTNSLNDYNKFIFRKRIFLLAVFIITILIAVTSINVGSMQISIKEIINVFLGSASSKSRVVMQIRLPRILTSLLVGAILGMSGAIMQCVLRNPLASSSTIGVSQGAAFGAALGIVVFSGGRFNSASASNIISIDNPYIVTFSAFIFGSISSIIVLTISKIKNNTSPATLILVGVALSSMFGGGMTLLQYFADETKLGALVFWTFGNLGRTSYREIIILLIIFLLAYLYFSFNKWNYNAIVSGVKEAKNLGVNTDFVILSSMLVCSLSSAVAVSFVGIISFVGLIAPHIIRRFVGDDFRFLIFGSAILGSLILLVSDIIAKMIIPPVILPIGAITSFFGAIMFLFIIFRGGNINA